MSASVNVKYGGFNKSLRKLKQQMLSKSKSALDKYSKEIQQESIRECPKDTGALSNSSYIEKEDSSEEIKRVIGYGGDNVQINPRTGQPTSEYATIVHEDLSRLHPNGKSKFLEDPSRRFGDNYAYRLKGDLK